MKMFRSGLLIIILFFIVGLQAQTNINSPYSRFGLGDLAGKNTNTTLQGMGGISFGYADPTMINPANPASYASFDSATFIFEAGIFADFKTLKTTALSESGYFSSLSYILLGFPITRWWRTSLGVLPFSKIGYDVKITVDVEGFSNVENSIEGDGGLNQVYWGNAFKIGKNLRLGINATYIFGESRHRSVIDFVDSLLILGTKTETRVRGSDFIFDYGAQYDIHISDKQQLTLGLIYANRFNMNVTRSYLATTIFNGQEGGVDVVRDTISYTPDQTGSVILPAKIGFGFTYKQINNWLVGADFEWQNWTDFGGFGVQDTLDNAWRIAVGGEFTPNHTSLSTLFSRMTYRLGFRYNNTYLSFGDNQINEFGISFGFNFPLRKTKTSLDLGLEVGKRGTTKNNPLQENFINFTFGVSINENWFNKRKYQ